MEKIIDILDIPVEELQTRGGNKILSVFKTNGDDLYDHRLVIYEREKDDADHLHTGINGKFKSQESCCDVILKKKKVLYIKTMEQLIKDGATIQGYSKDRCTVEFEKEGFVTTILYDRFDKKQDDDRLHATVYYDLICVAVEE